MLAQNFKTAVDLGIKDAEIEALIKVLGMLERSELVPSPPRYSSVPNGFNMLTIGHQDQCGTVGCILGWCQYIGGESLFRDETGFVQLTEGASNLFMFGVEGRGKVTPEQAALALRSYLTTGDANWAEALA